jgi:uroporphyrinogen-III decarboxylase
MDELTARERLIRTFEGKEIDRIPTYDIIHNIDLIEYLTESKVTSKNAEDLLCKAANACLDLIRHFAVPLYEGEKIISEDDGFTYRYEWWTGRILKKPFYKTVEDVVRTIEQDTEKLIDCTGKKKICSEANNHVNLFYEKFEYFEEVCQEYKRISEKLSEKTVMLGPEMCMGVSIAIFRHGIDWFSFVYHDYPEVIVKYLDAYYDYELAFVDSYIDLDIMPVVCSAGSIGMDDRLFFPANFYKEVIIPREKKLFDRFKKYGKYILAFLDGFKLPVIKDFLDIGADAIDPFEPYCRMDVNKFRKEYNNIVICQPIDCTQLLAFGSEEDVKKAVIKAIEDAGRKRILIGSTSEIHPKVNFKNALSMYETARNYVL